MKRWMQGKMQWKWALPLALMLAPAFLTAQVASLDGTWQIHGSVADNPVETTCVLKTAEGAVTGTCIGVDGQTMPVTGTVTDAKMIWSYESVYDGGKIVLHYTATLQGDGTLAGGILVDPYDAAGDFTATRSAAAAQG
jgi:hypothetical protein